MNPSLEILYEDNHLLAVAKPAGLPTMGVSAGRPSLINVAKAYIKGKYHKPGNVYLGVVSRLDAPVTGVVLFARTSKAARRLTEQFRTRAVTKRYLAAVEGILRPRSGRWVDWVVRDQRSHRVKIVAPGYTGAKQAVLELKRLAVRGRTSVLRIVPETGRKHQIRIQLASRGHPILGDRQYGSSRSFPAGIALHAWQLVLEHPVRGETVRLQAPLPPSWNGLAIARTIAARADRH
ncbi:MAG TPA: RluA family pseudouridine synthase [Planctomycetaceae bacterium]|nr:RluA family pseudouridine synthase [Planctomycetaceae bacterium]